MSLHLTIPDPLAAKVTAAAAAQGKRPEELVLEAIENKLNPLARLDELMAPVRERMKELGITEDEAVEDFEREKHAMRAEQQAAAK